MKAHPSRCAPVLLALAFALLASGGAAADELEAQLRFGTGMAQRGLWSEALFRFRQAEGLSPGNARVLNNVAVAYEATGRFEEALAAYKEALKLEPANADIKRNYARFVEFYQAFKPRAKTPPPPAAEPEPKPAPKPEQPPGS